MLTLLTSNPRQQTRTARSIRPKDQTDFSPIKVGFPAASVCHHAEHKLSPTHLTSALFPCTLLNQTTRQQQVFWCVSSATTHIDLITIPTPHHKSSQIVDILAWAPKHCTALLATSNCPFPNVPCLILLLSGALRPPQIPWPLAKLASAPLQWHLPRETQLPGTYLPCPTHTQTPQKQTRSSIYAFFKQAQFSICTYRVCPIHFPNTPHFRFPPTSPPPVPRQTRPWVLFDHFICTLCALNFTIPSSTFPYFFLPSRSFLESDHLSHTVPFHSRHHVSVPPWIHRWIPPGSIL